MTAISEVGSASTALPSTLSSEASGLGKDDFLQLLVAQLQNQDPLNPSDPTEFTAQLAQFSSLEQLFAVNDNLAVMSAVSSDMERMSALSLIGRDVVSDGGIFTYDGGSLELGYRLEEGVSEVQLQVVDSGGRTVALLQGEGVTAGDHFLSWSGTDDGGQVIPPGRYRLVASALQGEEAVTDVTALVKGTVSGVNLEESGSVLTTSAGEFALADVTSVGGI